MCALVRPGRLPFQNIFSLLFSFPAHSPDNSFLGFAVPQRKGNNGIKTRKAALVYGKDPGFWKVRKKIKPE